MVALKVSTFVDNSKQLLQKIADLHPMISDFKQNYGLTADTIEKRSQLKFDKSKYVQLKKRITNQDRIKDCQTWDKRADIDLKLLEDRID